VRNNVCRWSQRFLKYADHAVSRPFFMSTPCDGHHVELIGSEDPRALVFLADIIGRTRVDRPAAPRRARIGISPPLYRAVLSEDS
jgi:hypothetical protein